jgi:hypothetical protein
MVCTTSRDGLPDTSIGFNDGYKVRFRATVDCSALWARTVRPVDHFHQAFFEVFSISPEAYSSTDSPGELHGAAPRNRAELPLRRPRHFGLLDPSDLDNVLI